MASSNLTSSMVACDSFPDSTSINCSEPWGWNCVEKAGFEPHRLWNITLNIWNQCANDTRLWQNGTYSNIGNASLSDAACDIITVPHRNRILRATAYSARDTWGRLATWKIPLFQLVASSPRPPLGFWSVGGFVIAHLMGDPIGTMQDLLHKIHRCQQHAEYWKQLFSTKCGNLLTEEQAKREAKAFAMITISYDEFGEGERVRKILQEALEQFTLRSFIERDYPNLDVALWTPGGIDQEIAWRMNDYGKSLSTAGPHYPQLRKAFVGVIERITQSPKEAQLREVVKSGTAAKDSRSQSVGQLLSSTPSQVPAPRPPRKEELMQLVTFLRLCNHASDALAADRTTSFLPIMTAQLLFIFAIAAALFRTVSDNGATLLINVEAHSIAFSALYFWILPASYLSSVIGVSQTENAMPAILDGFRVQLKHEIKGYKFTKLAEWKTLGKVRLRVEKGGIYSWIPHRSRAFGLVALKTPWKPQKYGKSAEVTWWILQSAVPFILVSAGAILAMVMSLYVPPHGWEARHCAEASIYLTWVGSFLFTLLFKLFFSPVEGQYSWCFGLTYAKDIIAGGAVFAGILVTQIGVFNRCLSYTRWGRNGLYLPQQPDTQTYLISSIHAKYIIITSVGIGLNFIFAPLYLWLRYGEAQRVLWQQDDHGTKSSKRKTQGGKNYQPQSGEDTETAWIAKALEARTYDESTDASEISGEGIELQRGGNDSSSDSGAQPGPSGQGYFSIARKAVPTEHPSQTHLLSPTRI